MAFTPRQSRWVAGLGGAAAAGVIFVVAAYALTSAGVPVTPNDDGTNLFEPTTTTTVVWDRSGWPPVTITACASCEPSSGPSSSTGPTPPPAVGTLPTTPPTASTLPTITLPTLTTTTLPVEVPTTVTLPEVTTTTEVPTTVTVPTTVEAPTTQPPAPTPTHELPA
jgi:hypothetical protein